MKLRTAFKHALTFGSIVLAFALTPLTTLCLPFGTLQDWPGCLASRILAWGERTSLQISPR
jgi:hypothetical protein